MKKVLALILALVMALSLVACGNDGDDIPDKPEGPITIKVSTAQKGDGFTVLTDAAAAFNASQSDYVVDLYYGGSYTEIMTIMQTSTEADRPDIFASSGNDTALYIAMEDKMYIPVQDFMDAEGYEDNIIASLRANYMRDGKWQCWPLGNTNVGQYYNTDVLAAAGVDGSALASYQEIYDACEKLSGAGYKNFYYCRALTHFDWLNYALTAQGIQYYDAENGRAGIPTKCLYDDGADCQKATTAFFQFLIDVVAKGDWILDPTISSSDAWVSFAAQDVLLMDGYVSGANSIVSLVADSGNPFPWTYEVSPVVEAGKPNKGQSPGGGALFIAKTGDYWREQGAWEFMKYLLNDDVVCDYAMATGYVPITTTGAETAEYKDYIKNEFPSAATVIAAQDATEEGIAYAPVPFSSSVNTAYKDICQKILADPSYTAEMAVAELTEKTNEAIDLYRLTEGLD